ncbi:MAG: cytochrome c oxidase subunit 3 family protein [Planctomycetota bacterium]
MSHDQQHDGGQHPAHLQHHFDTSLQQFEAGKLGMWLFLATEVLLFGGLFCAYSIYRGNHPEIFHYGHQFLDKILGATNTVILLASSLTMALAVRCAQIDRKGRLQLFLALTFLGGFGFMVIKYVEYSHKFHEGLFPGIGFDYEELMRKEEAGRRLRADEANAHGSGGDAEGLPVAEIASAAPRERSEMADAPRGPAGLAAPVVEGGHGDGEEGGHVLPANRPENAHIFFSIYFMMTGLHGIHVLAGMAIIAWLFFRARKGHFGREYFTPVDLGGLYWHLVDLIWIYLFPLLYLIE